MRSINIHIRAWPLRQCRSVNNFYFMITINAVDSIRISYFVFFHCEAIPSHMGTFAREIQLEFSESESQFTSSEACKLDWIETRTCRLISSPKHSSPLLAHLIIMRERDELKQNGECVLNQIFANMRNEAEKLFFHSQRIFFSRLRYCDERRCQMIIDHATHIKDTDIYTFCEWKHRSERIKKRVGIWFIRAILTSSKQIHKRLWSHMIFSILLTSRSDMVIHNRRCN